MGHSGRTGRALRRQVLVEVAHRNVAPTVGRQVMHNPISPRQVAIELTLPVVRFNLGSKRIPGKPQMLHE